MNCLVKIYFFNHKTRAPIRERLRMINLIFGLLKISMKLCFVRFGGNSAGNFFDLKLLIKNVHSASPNDD